MNREIRNDLEEARRARRVHQDEIDRAARLRAYVVISVAAAVLAVMLAFAITHRAPVVP